jgi:hypothetical protein
VQGTVCKILAQGEVKPHKVRYYLEGRDAEGRPSLMPQNSYRIENRLYQVPDHGTTTP